MQKNIHIAIICRKNRKISTYKEDMLKKYENFDISR